MRKCLILSLAVLSAWLALPAFADDGDPCTDKHYTAGVLDSGPTCTMVSGVRRQFLCDSQTEAVDDTSCTIDVAIAEGASACVISILEQQPACTIPTMTIEEGDNDSGADYGWTTLGTLTGLVSPLLSQVDPGRPVGAVLRATFTDITDTDCTRVSVVLKCFY